MNNEKKAILGLVTILNEEIDLEQRVKDIGKKPETTQDHYGDYLNLITTIKSLVGGLVGINAIGNALIVVGGNVQGIQSAIQAIKLDGAINIKNV